MLMFGVNGPLRNDNVNDILDSQEWIVCITG